MYKRQDLGRGAAPTAAVPGPIETLVGVLRRARGSTEQPGCDEEQAHSHEADRSKESAPATHRPMLRVAGGAVREDPVAAFGRALTDK